MNTQFKRPEDSPGLLLWRLTMNWQREIRATLKPFELTHPEFVYLACLLWLSSQDTGPIQQKHITLAAQMDKMVVSQTTQKLLKRDLITRKPHPVDSRGFEIALTPAGKKLTNQALPKVEETDQMYFSENKNAVENFCETAGSRGQATDDDFDRHG